MDKFKIGHLVDYFIKVNKEGVSFKSLSQEDMLSLAILSVFDKKGKTVKTTQYTYERPDDVISQDEFNMTKAEYEKTAKQIEKAIKKEVGKDFSALKVPTYEDLQAMMKDDNKIDFEEIHAFAREGVIVNSTAKKPEFHGIPEKAKSNEVPLETMSDFVSSVANDDERYAVIEKFENMTDEEYNNFYKSMFKVPEDTTQRIAEFKPETDVAYNKQDGLNGIQFNSHGQKIFRINSNAGMYESYKYADADDTRFSEMMRYNENGYKIEYWKQESYRDEKGNSVPCYRVYILNEDEKVQKIATVPEGIDNSKDIQDFNDFNFYQQYCRYYDKLDENGKL